MVRLRAVFRRFVLVFMMCLLPLQWSWAAAASVCEHESGGKAHFGHHEHQHADDTGSDAGSHSGPAAEHPDCQVCHGVGAACVAPFEGNAHLWAARAPYPDYARVLPDPPVESFLRPPLSPLVA